MNVTTEFSRAEISTVSRGYWFVFVSPCECVFGENVHFYVQTPPQKCKSETKIPVQKVRKTQKEHKKINPGVCRHTGSKNEAWLRG